MECWLHDFHEDGDGMVGYEFDITWWWVGYAYEAIGIVNGKGDKKGWGGGERGEMCGDVMLWWQNFPPSTLTFLSMFNIY
jgi:hypothetical protein